MEAMRLTSGPYHCGEQSFSKPWRSASCSCYVWSGRNATLLRFHFHRGHCSLKEHLMMRPLRVFVGLLMACLLSPSVLHAQAPSARLAETSRVSFTLQYRVTGKPGTDKVELTA